MYQEIDSNEPILRADAGFKRLFQMVVLGEGFQLLIVVSDSARIIQTALHCLEKGTRSQVRPEVGLVRVVVRGAP